MALNLSVDTDVNIPSSSSFVFNNTMNLASNVLIKTGDGDLIFNNLLGAEGGMVNTLGSTASGGGVVTGNVENAGGSLAPGNSPGVFENRGDHRQGTGGNRLVQIAGTIAGTEHDLLVVNGSATLDGVLEILLLGDYQPLAGDQFPVFDFARTLGEFDTIGLPALLNGLS